MTVRLPLVAVLAWLLAVATMVAAQAPAKKRLLFLTHAGLYKHTSLGPAERAVADLGEAGGFDVVTVEGYKQDAAHIDLKFLTPEPRGCSGAAGRSSTSSTCFGTAPWDASRPDENVDVLFGNRIPMGFSRERVHVLLSLDTERTNIAGFPDVARGGDYPQAWWREYGKGRSFYTSLGHRDDIWSHDPVFRAHIRGAIRWALRLED